ncbi:stimulated by retinoic acid gene 6 protein-like [Oscarella lobularis]|uniref:stimulated by retinoic acid gene 6 protein-like n=1 Tax=Oscarella lobularis TaxID=121494 RepID=UPI0033144239
MDRRLGNIRMQATATPSSLSLNDTTLSCTEESSGQILLALWVIYALPAILVLVVYSHFQKRIRLCLNCCHGVPSILVPINLLDSKENRFVCVAAFGASASSMLSLLNLDFGSVTNVAAIEALLIIAFVVVLAIVYSPIFVCIDAPHKISGYVVGFIYTGGWFVIQLMFFIRCTVLRVSGAKLAVQILVFLPVFSCIFIVDMWFLYMIIKSMVNACKRNNITLVDDDNEDLDKPYQTAYVEKLLKKVTDEEEPEPKGCMRKIFYEWDKTFKYPTRILATYLIAAIYIFQLTVIFLDVTVSWSVSFSGWLGTIDVALIRNTALQRIVGGLQKVSLAWIGSFFTSCLVSSFISVVFLLRMMSSYRKDMKTLYKGDKSILPANLPSPTSSVLATFKYSGYQIAYIFWGWFIILLVLLIVCLIVALCVYWIEIDYKSFLVVLYVLLAPCIFSLVLWLFQFLFVKFGLLQDKGKNLALTNRRLYHSVGFFFFFYNVMLGIWSCLLRLCYSLGLGILFISRLDLSVLPQILEMLDPGYKVYVGYLIMDYHHSNPTLVSFAYIIRKAARKLSPQPLASSQDVEMKSEEKEKMLSGRRARNRWFVAVTLMRNPILKADRFSGAEFKPRIAEGKDKSKREKSIVKGKKDEESLLSEQGRRQSSLPLVSETKVLENGVSDTEMDGVIV